MTPLIIQNEFKTNYKYSKPESEWKYAVCPDCGSSVWKIIFTDLDETSAQCVNCYWMDTVQDHPFNAAYGDNK